MWVIDIFVDELDLATLGFEDVTPADTGRPAYHPADLLKLYIYGYLNRIQSGRRLEREAQRNIELMWLTGRLTPDFKTINFSQLTIFSPTQQNLFQMCKIMCQVLNILVRDTI